MEAKGDRKRQAWTLLAEALGTALLVLGLNWGGVGSDAPVVVGLTLFMVMEVLGPIGGNLFNPAVTLAMMIKLKHGEAEASPFFGLLIIVAQMNQNRLDRHGALSHKPKPKPKGATHSAAPVSRSK